MGLPITRSQFLMQAFGLDFYWETFSGLDDQTQVTEYSDGLSNRTYPLMGPRKMNEMTLTKSFNPLASADGAIIQWYKDFCQDNGLQHTVVIAPIRYCPQIELIGPQLTLYGAKPIGLKGFEADKKSQDVSMLELRLIADDWAYGENIGTPKKPAIPNLGDL
jgi:hypothetical protein